MTPTKTDIANPAIADEPVTVSPFKGIFSRLNSLTYRRTDVMGLRAKAYVHNVLNTTPLTLRDFKAYSRQIGVPLFVFEKLVWDHNGAASLKTIDRIISIECLQAAQELGRKTEFLAGEDMLRRHRKEHDLPVRKVLSYRPIKTASLSPGGV